MAPPRHAPTTVYATECLLRRPKFKVHLSLRMARNAIQQIDHGIPRGGTIYQLGPPDLFSEGSYWIELESLEPNFACVACGEPNQRHYERCVNPSARYEHIRFIHNKCLKPLDGQRYRPMIEICDHLLSAEEKVLRT